MRLKLPRPAAALLTFLIGVSLASVWFFVRRQPLPASRTIPPAPIEEIIPSPSESPSLGSSDGVSSGREPHHCCEEFPSAAKANEAMRKALDPYVFKIISRGTKMDLEGRRVGRRAVAVFCCGREGQQAAHIFWTEGGKFCDIIAPTVERALNFEKAKKL